MAPMVLPTLFERLLHRFHRLPVPIMDAFSGVLFGRVLAIAVRRGVIECTAQRALTVEQMAAETGLDVRATALLSSALAASGYLRQTSAGYMATPDARTWLLRDSPHSLYHLILYFETLHERWQKIECALDHGGPVRPYYEAFTEADWETYVLGMRDLARLLLPGVMKRLRILPEDRFLLDIGASHALYSIECCRRLPSLKVTLMDFPSALEHGQRLVDEAGLSARFSVVAGDFTSMPFPPGQDLILMFNIIHGFDAAMNQRLVRRALDALRPEGRLYVLDQFASRRRGSPLSQFIPLTVGLNLLNEAGGSAYSVEEVSAWCRGAKVSVKGVGLPAVRLVEARREGN